MPGEGIGADLFSRASGSSSNRRSLQVFTEIFENYVPELMCKSAALPHRMTGASHTNKDVFTHRIKHRQPMFVCIRINNRDVVPRESLDEPDQVS